MTDIYSVFTSDTMTKHGTTDGQTLLYKSETTGVQSMRTVVIDFQYFQVLQGLYVTSMSRHTNECGGIISSSGWTFSCRKRCTSEDA